MKRMIEKSFFQAMLNTNSETSIREQNNLEMLFTEYLAEQLSSEKSYLVCGSLVYARIELMMKIETSETSSEKSNAPNLFRRKLLLLLESCISLMKHQLAHSRLKSETENENQKLSLLQWSDSQIELIELILALHETKSINNGKESLKSLISSFEKIFNIKLKTPYVRVSEITKRKKNRLLFIDKLHSSLSSRFLDGDY